MIKNVEWIAPWFLVEIACMAPGCGGSDASPAKSPEPEPAAPANPRSSTDGRAARASTDSPKTSSYRALCEKGDAEACGALGAAYYDGDGVEQNYGTAAQFFQRSCDGGSASGCGRLGVMYNQSSKGVSKNVPRAAELLRRSCDLGNPNGCMGAGALLEMGNGVPQNWAEAAALYERGCKGGAEKSCQLQKALNARQSSVK